MTDLLPVPGPVAEPARRTAHPVRALLLSRVATGVASVILISIIVYVATLVLPGDAATAILGQQATPERLAALRDQLHLNQSPIGGYLSWAKAALQGDFGTSLTRTPGCGTSSGPRSGQLGCADCFFGDHLHKSWGVLLGMWAAARRDSCIDHSLSVGALVASALPEFVVAVFVVMVFAVTVFALVPGGEHPARG